MYSIVADTAATVLLVAQRWLPIVQVNSTSFSSNQGTNGGAMAMQSVTNATLTGITAAGNTAAYGAGMLIDRAALIQVPSLRRSSASAPTDLCKEWSGQTALKR